MYSKVAPSGPLANRLMLLRSSMGTSSAGRLSMNQTINPPATSRIGNASHRRRKNASSERRYPCAMRWKKGSVL